MLVHKLSKVCFATVTFVRDVLATGCMQIQSGKSLDLKYLSWYIIGCSILFSTIEKPTNPLIDNQKLMTFFSFSKITRNSQLIYFCFIFLRTSLQISVRRIMLTNLAMTTLSSSLKSMASSSKVGASFLQ